MLRDVLMCCCCTPAESITFGGGAPASFRPTTIRPVSLEHLKYNANKMLERKRARLVAATNAAMSPFAL